MNNKKSDILEIPTAEEMATTHVRGYYYGLVKDIVEDINYSASRGHTNISTPIPIDFLEAIVRTFISKGYEVECLGQDYSEKGTRELVRFNWEGCYE